jgi:hypothetical protein
MGQPLSRVAPGLVPSPFVALARAAQISSQQNLGRWLWQPRPFSGCDSNNTRKTFLLFALRFVFLRTPMADDEQYPWLPTCHMIILTLNPFDSARLSSSLMTRRLAVWKNRRIHVFCASGMSSLLRKLLEKTSCASFWQPGTGRIEKLAHWGAFS